MRQKISRMLSLAALLAFCFLQPLGAQGATTTRLDVPESLTYLFFGRVKLADGRVISFSADRFHVRKSLQPAPPSPPGPDYMELGNLSVQDKNGNSLFEASSLKEVAWSGRWKASGRSQWFAGTVTFTFEKASKVADGISLTYATVKYTQNVGGPPVCTIDIAKYPLHVRLPYNAQSGMSAALITSW